ncbi:MAG: diphosphomevalonate decarboxylase, partial [Spirochaetota bacterium]
MTVTACASPSLALVKYWGKLEGGVNLPATPSLGVTLGELRTTTTVTESRDADEVVVGGRRQPLEPYAPVIRLFRDRSSSSALRAGPIRVESENSFPTAAGLASSSSGFAAFALALDAWFETGLDREELSRAARMGSGSASRALWGGFTTWERGAAHAEPLLPASHWPELRVLVTVLHTGEKPVSSRAGMNRTSATSPIFEQWCDASQSVYERGLAALRAHKLDALGAAMRES